MWLDSAIEVLGIASLLATQNVVVDLATEQASTCLLFVDARCSCAQCYQADGIRGYRVTGKDPCRILRGCSEVQKDYGDTPRKASESHFGEQVAKHDGDAMLQLK